MTVLKIIQTKKKKSLLDARDKKLGTLTNFFNWFELSYHKNKINLKVIKNIY